MVIVNTLGRVSQGQIFEQSVYQNLRGKYDLTYLSKDGISKIDFVLDGTYALEVKQTFSKRDLSLLKRRSEMINVSEKYLVTNRFTDHPNAILAVDL